MTDVSVITVDGKNYLGIVKKAKGSIVVEDAMEFMGKSIDDKDIIAYIKERNLGDMPVLTFDGNGTTVGRALKKNEQAQFEMYESVFNLVKTNAQQRMENDYFDKELKE